MNRKRMTISIITVMVVIAMFASTASAQITVDGDGSDWDGLAGVKNITDVTHELWVTSPNCSAYQLNWDSGYDMAEFAVYYDAATDTIYFKFDTAGVPGDVDGDGDPNGCTNCTGDCRRGSVDAFEVTVGNYKAGLDVTGDGNENFRVIYTADTIYVKDHNETMDHTANFTTEHSIGGGLSPPYTNAVVEVSVCPAHNFTGFGACGNVAIVTEARCGSANDYCSEDWIGQLLLNRPPQAVLSGNDVCYCTDTVFSSAGSNDPDGIIVAYEWDFGDGNTSAEENTTHHYGAVGAYAVTLTVTDDFGFSCTSDAITVHVYENPTADFSNTTVNFCEDTQFTDQTTGGTPPYTYQWDFGDGNTSTEENPTNHYPAPGDYTACLNITDANDCTDEICKPVHVRSNPPVPVPKARGIGCLVVELNASESYDRNPGGYIVQYEWDLDNNGDYEIDRSDPLYQTTFAEADCGYRTIGLRVTNNASVNNSTTVQIYVDCPPTCSCTVNRTEVPASGGWVLFDGSGSTDENVTSLNYTWDIMGDTYYGKTVAYNVTGATRANLTVRDEYDCEDTCNVSVGLESEKGDPHADANGPYKTCVGYSIIFDASGSWCEGCTIDLYEWDVDNDGTFDISSPDPIIEYTYPGEYRGIVRLRVTVDACGNMDNDTAYVIVEECDPAAVPVITPVGALALIGMMCIAGVGRIMKRDRRF